jgi:putative aldouronate transport system permease protein
MLREFRKQKYLQLFVIMGVLFLIVFSVVPMFGIIMAFKDYKITMGISGIFTSNWVGLKHFREFVNEYNFAILVKNTLIISFLKLIFTFPLPIFFALVLNEIRAIGFKRVVQTISYLPNFISWVIVAGLVRVFFSADSNGIINDLMVQMSLVSKPIPILTDPNYYYGLAVGTSMWKEMGWWSIIFLAALAGIDVQQYEAATLDGVSRLQKIWYITLPGIKGTVAVVLIMALGNLLGGGLGGSNFDQSYLLGNPANRSTSNIIQLYVFEVGLSQGRYAYATAVGLIQAVISLVLVLTSNYASKKVTGTGLF